MDDIHKIFSSKQEALGILQACKKQLKLSPSIQMMTLYFLFYRILTYGQQRIIEGEQLYSRQLNYMKQRNFSSS